MTTTLVPAFDAALTLARALESAGVPYAIAVFKLLFFRAKDLVDVERLVLVQQRDLDRAYVRGWLVDMMGPDDERVRAWDEIIGRAGPAK
jgi:hypothetical protein